MNIHDTCVPAAVCTCSGTKFWEEAQEPEESKSGGRPFEMKRCSDGPRTAGQEGVGMPPRPGKVSSRASAANQHQAPGTWG